MQSKRAIEPCESMAQIADIEIDQAEDIASGIAPRGKIRILLDPAPPWMASFKLLQCRDEGQLAYAIQPDDRGA